MFRPKLNRFLKYLLIGGAAAGTAISLKENDLDSIGIVRLSRAAYTIFQIGVIYKKDLYKTGLDKKSIEYKQIKSQCHLKGAQKLLDLCCTNKGVYIKAGQHIAALEYIIPVEYVKTMKVLHSHAPTNSIEDVYKVIKEEFKQKPSDLFTTFDPEPLGTASLAQVHKATLKDGSVVAVKVQHPYVQGNAKVDIMTMEYLVKIMGWVFPEFKFKWLVDESKKNIPKELNFIEEGHNAEKVAKLFEDYEWLYIPKIRWELTTSRVLTMEFVEGGQVNDLAYIKENKINPLEVADKLGKLYSKMIFIDGFVHSDPHPGNILVRNSNKGGSCDIILLDHGLYANLSDQLRVEYANLWLSILNRDRVAMRQASTKLGIQGNMYGLFACMVSGRPWEAILKGIDKQTPNTKETEFIQNEFSNVLPQISEVLESVNRQMLLILKTNDLMRGIEHTLKTSKTMGSFCVMSKCCVNSVYNQRILAENSKLQRFNLKIRQYWEIFKIQLYYTIMTWIAISNRIVG